MKEVKWEDAIKIYESYGRVVLPKEQRNVFCVAYSMGIKDGKMQGKQEMMDFLNKIN